MFEWIGWLATALFAASYLCKNPALLRGMQAAGALLWIGYGMAIHAQPVVVANLIVAVMALVSVLISALGRPRGRGNAMLEE